MRAARFVVAAAAFAAVFALPGVAQAAVSQTFHADSGDACRYGVTDGTLNWRFGSTSPVPVTAVDVSGKLTDHPQPIDPVTQCRDDGYYSTATFVAYSGSVEVDRASRSVDNGSVALTFTLNTSTFSTSINRVVVQVCRSPLHTVPPSYCGRAVTYLAPPAA
ncbi:hypothetical protein Cs7R123_67060 [Catellatospora sp. TT07R-123]|uniref:hypothetical protein n=1 Tax=Catellatospora sp. TT07R-123 TaxID=2733863 RepID=UPI001B250182|nr:hypothetical protein [Catellatospora sp. TT07R-123]GHJ49364.1 hypothetical protein Cs7R123_67060 [Catellatospora sp. TT07R-123]